MVAFDHLSNFDWCCVLPSNPLTTSINDSLSTLFVYKWNGVTYTAQIHTLGGLVPQGNSKILCESDWLLWNQIKIEILPKPHQSSTNNFVLMRLNVTHVPNPHQDIQTLIDSIWRERKKPTANTRHAEQLLSMTLYTTAKNGMQMKTKLRVSVTFNLGIEMEFRFPTKQSIENTFE